LSVVVVLVFVSELLSLRPVASLSMAASVAAPNSPSEEPL
jgi:hypothetical protein